MTTPESCEELLSKATKLSEEYNLKVRQSRLPVRMLSAEEAQKDPIIMTVELMERMKAAEKETERLKPLMDKAWDEYFKCLHGGRVKSIYD